MTNCWEWQITIFISIFKYSSFSKEPNTNEISLLTKCAYMTLKVAATDI